MTRKSISDAASQRLVASGHTYGHLALDADHRNLDSPMEKAMRFVERYTKRPRETWEHIPGHPFVLAADALAKRMVGIDDRPKPYVGRGTRQARPPRSKNRPLPFTEN